MAIEGSQLARAMLSIHELEMSQSAKHPGSLLSERIERRVAFRPRDRRLECRIGTLLVRTGLRLQEYGMISRRLPLGNSAVQR